MTTHVGKDGQVYSGSNAIAEVEDWSFDTTANIVSDTAMGDDWETSKVTTKAWSGSMNVMWDPSDSTGQETLEAGAELTLKLYPTGNTSGQIEYSGSALISGVTRNGSKGDLVKASVSFTGTGAVTQATVA